MNDFYRVTVWEAGYEEGYSHYFKSPETAEKFKEDTEKRPHPNVVGQGWQCSINKIKFED